MAGPWEQYAQPAETPDGPWKAYAPQAPEGFAANALDAIKGIPRNLLAGVMDAATSGAQAEAHSMSQPDMAAEIPNTEQALSAVEPVTGHLYEPQGTAGKIVGAGARMVTNPASYVGPGSIPLKITGGILSGMGSEAAGQAADGTKYETPARIAGALAGGAAAGKLAGPSIERAAVPTADELKAAAGSGYDTARNSGLVLDPQAVSKFASTAEQELSGPRYGFTGGQNGVAPKTFGILSDLQNPPAGATVTASNLDALRQNLRHVASETQLTGAGPKPTPDAAAASILADRVKAYMESVPASDTLAGDASDYVRAIKEANGNYAAASRADTLGAKFTRAENQAERARGVGFDDTIRTKIAGILDNPKQQRGFSDEEVAAMQKLHDGTLPTNAAREIGKFGVKGGLSLALHTGAALGTGGATLPLTVAGTLSRKIADALSRRQAGKLDEMIRMRSPEYQSRAAAIPPPDTMPNRSAVIRALLAAGR